MPVRIVREDEFYPTNPADGGKGGNTPPNPADKKTSQPRPNTGAGKNPAPPKPKAPGK